MTQLRPVTVENRTIPAAPRTRPDLVWLPIADLVVDDIYQRPLLAGDWKHIRQIGENFQWERFTPCIVAPVVGERSFALIDGQHRAHGAAMAGEDEVPCFVVDLDTKAQASAFTWINGNVTAITTFHVYKAGLAAGEPWAIGCRDAVTAAGGQLMTSNASTANKQPGEIYAINLIRRFVDRGQPEVVRDGLGAILASHQATDVRLFADGILRPWLMVVAERPGLTRKDLIGFLETFNLWKVQVSVWQQRQEDEFSHLSSLELMKKSLKLMMDQHFGVRG